jgi:spore coat protein JC
MIGTMCHQLLKGVSCEELIACGYDPSYVEHGVGVYPANAAGVPFTAAYIQSKGDPVTDLTENMAAEQKAKQTYEYLINMADDPDVIAPLRFLREREIVHFQRFGEILEDIQERNCKKKYY